MHCFSSKLITFIALSVNYMYKQNPLEPKIKRKKSTNLFRYLLFIYLYAHFTTKNIQNINVIYIFFSSFFLFECLNNKYKNVCLYCIPIYCMYMHKNFPERCKEETKTFTLLKQRPMKYTTIFISL